jgi:hypothetical protein
LLFLLRKALKGEEGKGEMMRVGAVAPAAVILWSSNIAWLKATHDMVPDGGSSLEPIFRSRLPAILAKAADCACEAIAVCVTSWVCLVGKHPAEDYG